MAKDKDDNESTSFKDVAQMSPEQRATRTYKKQVYNGLVSLHKAIHEAKQAGVNIGNVVDLDCSIYFDAVRQNEKLEYVSMGKYMGR